MTEANDFAFMRNVFRKEIENSISTGRVSDIKIKFDEHESQPTNSQFTNTRSALDQALRERLIDMLTDEEQGVDEYRKFLDVCIAICRLEMAVPVLSVVLLSDIFDSSTIEVCEKLFMYVEENVSTWKEPLFFSNCKNNILRMCNDLLRRLSRSQNTVFCGRILLFLAMFFPFSERSGLNIVSEFNLENETFYDKEPSSELESCVEVVPESQIKIDHTFYVKFWSLQDYFRNPNQCYYAEQWEDFKEHSKMVLHVFKHFKVEADPSETSVKSEESHFFAKYLTSQKLMVLQLNDVHFRRTIYLQFLIIFQYLNANVKSKPEGFELNSEQATWIKETTRLIHTLIKETPPDGDWFLKVVLLELERDECWSEWKNEGCPTLKQASTNNEPVTGFRSRRPLGQIVKESVTSGKLIVTSTKKDERPTIFNVKPELLKALGRRKLVPDLHERFEEIAQQADPAAMIEQQYKRVNSFHFAWSSLRVLSMKSAHFYAVSHKPVPKLPDYLELMSKRILRDRLLKELAAQAKTDSKDARENVEKNETRKMDVDTPHKGNEERKQQNSEDNLHEELSKDSKEAEDEPMDENGVDKSNDIKEKQVHDEQLSKVKTEEEDEEKMEEGMDGIESMDVEVKHEQLVDSDGDIEDGRFGKKENEDYEDDYKQQSEDESHIEECKQESDDEEDYKQHSEEEYPDDSKQQSDEENAEDSRQHSEEEPTDEESGDDKKKGEDSDLQDSSDEEDSQKTATEREGGRESGSDLSDDEKVGEEIHNGSDVEGSEKQYSECEEELSSSSEREGSEEEKLEGAVEKSCSDDEIECEQEVENADSRDMSDVSSGSIKQGSDTVTVENEEDENLEEGEVKDDSDIEEADSKVRKVQTRHRMSTRSRSNLNDKHETVSLKEDKSADNISKNTSTQSNVNKKCIKNESKSNNTSNDEDEKVITVENNKDIEAITEDDDPRELEEHYVSDNDGDTSKESKGFSDNEELTDEEEKQDDEREDQLLEGDLPRSPLSDENMETEIKVITRSRSGLKRKSEDNEDRKGKLLKLSEENLEGDTVCVENSTNLKANSDVDKITVGEEKSVNGSDRLGAKTVMKEDNGSSKNILKKGTIEKIAEGISLKWQKVAETLGFKKNEIECFSTQNATDEERAKNMLYFWWSNEESATPEKLKECLQPLNLSHAVDIVLAKS